MMKTTFFRQPACCYLNVKLGISAAFNVPANWLSLPEGESWREGLLCEEPSP